MLRTVDSASVLSLVLSSHLLFLGISYLLSLPYSTTSFPQRRNPRTQAGSLSLRPSSPPVTGSTTAIVINAETTERSEMWDRACESGPQVPLLSPEQLISKCLEKLTNDLVFRGRVCALAVDEVHLLNSLGNSFRKAYQQIQFVHA